MQLRGVMRVSLDLCQYGARPTIVCTAKGFGREELSQRSAEMLAVAGGTRDAMAPAT
jgi:hypothetical protein